METKQGQPSKPELFGEQCEITLMYFPSECLLRTNKKYAMLPMILPLLGFRVILVLGSTRVAPFTYILLSADV